MEQAGSQDIAGSRTRVPGYTLDRGISVDRAGALVDAHDDATGSRVTIRLLSPALSADAAYRRQVRHDMAVLARCGISICSSVIDVRRPRRRDRLRVRWTASRSDHLVDVSGSLPPAAALVVFDDCLSALEAFTLPASSTATCRRPRCTIDTGGTAILRDAGVPAPPLRHGWRAGTPQYMAPELWAGRPHTVATDIYAATGVLVDALTGRPPYLGTDLTGLGVQHTHGALPSEAVPMLDRELVIHGLAKDPARPARERGALSSRRGDRGHRLSRPDLARPGTGVAGGRRGGPSRRSGTRPAGGRVRRRGRRGTASRAGDRFGGRRARGRAVWAGRSGRSPRPR